MAASTELLNQMYDSNLNAKKASLEQDYNTSVANLNDQQAKSQAQTNANLNRAAVENQKAQRNYAEVKNAYGLTSGAMAQARMASDNQLQQDMTSLRAQQQANDQSIERQRGLLQQNYLAAIREAQASNDAARAEKLYALAREEEKALAAAQASGSYGGGYGGGGGDTPGTSDINYDDMYGNAGTGRQKTTSSGASGNSVGNVVGSNADAARQAIVEALNKVQNGLSYSGRSGKF